MGCQVEPAQELGPHRGVADDRVTRVAVARSDDREIDRQHKYRRSDRARPRHQLLGIAAIAHHVELKPRRRRGRARDLLDAADRHSRLDERDPGRFGGTGGLHLRAAREHASQADRSQDHRQRQPLTQHLDRVLAHRDVAHHDLTQQDALEIGDVRAQRRLLVGAAVGVIEQLSR